MSINHDHSAQSAAAIVVSLLLLLATRDLLPASRRARLSSHETLNFGLLSVLSARHKAALIHDVIYGNRLDVDPSVGA